MAHAIRADEAAGRVLLADDEQYVRDILRLILLSSGFQVAEAVDGEEAVQKYLEAPQNFDVILMDLNMPRLGGDEAIRKIKAQHHQTQVILVSGGADRPPEIPGVRYLQKPFLNDELVRLVREAVAQARQG